jgi:CheY-like chemotaxis protein
LLETLKSYYKVVVALDGEKALKLAHADNPPDLILLDIMMPDIDGY